MEVNFISDVVAEVATKGGSGSSLL
jgi:hypothetical protein